MRLTKSGKPHAHSLSIQEQARLTGWQPADPRKRLREETRSYLGLLDRFDDGSRAAMIVREACKNLMNHLEGEQS